MERLKFCAPVAAQLRAAETKVIVTGAGGWLGQAALEMLCSSLGDGFAGRVRVFGSTARRMVLRSGRVVEVAAYADLVALTSRPALILHFAFLTRGFARQPDYVAVNRAITGVMRGFIDRNGAAGLFVPSSGAVYGPARALDADIAKNPYGVLKYQDELVYGEQARRLGFPAAIMRIFNLAGPFINNPKAYALASIIGDVRRGGKVELRAAHPVVRSYTHVADVLNIAVAILLRGARLEVFDTAGKEAVEIGELALRTGRLLTGNEVEVARPEWRDGKPDIYIGDPAGYRAAAALAGVELQTLDRQILDTAQYLQEALLF